MAQAKGLKPYPEPVKSDMRICFGIAWFATEEDAELHSEHMKKTGRTVNGGFFHGMQCGRGQGKGFDYDDPEHGRLYGSTF